MRHKALLSGLLLGVCACLASFLSTPSVGSDKVKEKLRYKVEQVQQGDMSAIFLSDLQSSETISIVNGSRYGGAFIAFYEAGHKSGLPALAISSNGLQLRRANGQLTFVSIDELADIGDKRLYPIEAARLRPK